MAILIPDKKKRLVVVIFIGFIAIFLALIIVFVNKSANKKPRNLNIILIAVDALRLDHLSCYGYGRNTSPNIDELAKKGTRFTQAITAGGWTIDSVPSILTGTYSPVHQIRGWRSLKNPKISTLAQLLKQKGYESVLWSNHGTLSYLDIGYGFQRVYTKRQYRNNKPSLSDYSLTSNIINRLKIKYKDLPFFFYIHYEGTHAPYRPPAPYKNMYLHKYVNNKSKPIPISTSTNGDEIYGSYGKIPYIVAENNITDPDYYISQYDGAISYTDTQIGRLLTALKDLGVDKNTLIVLIADHGEMLGEHNVYFTHSGMWEEVLKVPLIIKFPELFPEGKVISRQVSLVDIVPTILEILEFNKPGYLQGESLLSLIKPLRKYHTKQVLSFKREKDVLRTETWKLCHDTKTDFFELYNLKDDPKEQHNLISEKIDKAEEFKQKLINFKKSSAAISVPSKKGPVLTEKDIGQLKSLGYAQ